MTYYYLIATQLFIYDLSNKIKCLFNGHTLDNITLYKSGKTEKWGKQCYRCGKFWQKGEVK